MNGRYLQHAPGDDRPRDSRTDALCGAPVDTEYFDDSRITETPGPGREVVLARFELPMHYCGVFENFSQFVGNDQGEPLTRITTPGLEWRLSINNRPLFPYLKLEYIANPWGFSCCPVAIRLDENASLAFVVRNVSQTADPGGVQQLGGRITGRYWYNPAYGDGSARGSRLR